MIRVTIWNEFLQEQRKEEVARIYPKGMHGAIADGIRQDGFEISCATFNEPEHGLTQEKLDLTDVLIYWGHVEHKGFQDIVVDRICKRVHEGMGLIVLHSGHHSKLFRKLMGTSSICYGEKRMKKSDCGSWIHHIQS